MNAAWDRIRRGIDHFTKDEKRRAYELLELHVVEAVQDEFKVACAECVPGARPLELRSLCSIGSTVSLSGNELRDDHIIMNTARGRIKDRHVRRDPRVSLCVADEYRYVTVAGPVELDDDQATAQADIARLASLYQSRESAERNIARFRRQHRVTIRLRVERVIADGFES